MHVHTTEKLGSYTITIEQDDHDRDNPFEEWDGMPTVIHWHRNYRLGDQWPESWGNPFDDIEAAVQRIKDEYGARVVLPLYLYDHSGITVSTKPFSCQWDSGQVGFVFDTPKMLADGWGTDHPDDEALTEILVDAVKTFDQYLTGDVWGYVVEDGKGDVTDACWGFYGEDGIEDALSQARNCVPYADEMKAHPGLTEIVVC